MTGSATPGRDRALHHPDLVLPLGNDLLGQTANLLVVTVFELGLRHVDRALMLRNRHCNEISIDIAGRLDRHIGRHLSHDRRIRRQERPLIRWIGPVRDILNRYRAMPLIRPRRILGESKRSRRDRCSCRQRDHALADERA